MARARGPVPWTIALTALLLLGLRSSDQLAVWHDTPAIIARQLDFDPDSSTGPKIYASWLMASNRYDDAEQEFRIAIAALQREGKRGDGAVWYDYGNMLWREGRVSDAIEMYRQAIAHMPPEKVAMACNNLGLAYLVDGDPQAARQQFLNALAAQPDYADARRNLDRLDAVNR
jgi:Flp pilus assembly protein TadD